jgi:hypothetical protein
MPLVQRLRDTAQLRGQFPEWLLKEMEDAADEIERLYEALRASAASLETLAALSGKEELLRTMPDVRAYANSRAHVALGALFPNSADPAERRAA